MPNNDDNEEFEILDVGEHTWPARFLSDVSNGSPAKQITVGGIGGWFVGYTFAKIGKIAAFTVGGSLLMLQLASHQGYININWNRVNRHVANAKRELEKNASRRLPKIMEESEDFVRRNILIASGFAGGFLLGLASA